MRLSLAVVLALALSLLHAAPTAAAVIQAEVFVNAALVGGTAPVTVSNTGVTPQSATASATGGSSSLGGGSTLADLGAFLVDARSMGSITTGNFALQSDTVTITAPGVANGTIGTVTYSVLVNGNLSVSPDQRAATTWRLRADIGGGAFDIAADATLFNQGFITPGYQGDPFGIYTGTGTFQFGFAAPLTLELRTAAQTTFISAAQTPGTASIDQLSVCWGGISSVAVGANNLSAYSITSALGAGYAKAQSCGVPATVPAPGSPGLMLLGVLAFVGRRVVGVALQL